MTSRLNYMIRDLLDALRAEGVDVDRAVAKKVEIRLRYQHGGESVYIQSLPKQRRAAMVESAQSNLGTAARSIRAIARASGIPRATVHRILRGR